MLMKMLRLRRRSMAATQEPVVDAYTERGIASSDGYCYACPTPIREGEMWRRERVGTSVPHSFRLVHEVCPTV